MPRTRSDGERLRAAELATLRTSVEPWREKFPHVPVEEVAAHGDAAEVLIAMSTAADLVVVGTRAMVVPPVSCSARSA